jgi:hypothetical protein
VVPDTETDPDTDPDAAAEEAAAVPPQPPVPVPAPAPPVAPVPPAPPLPEPHGPTLTLITGDAQDASPSPKAPLRLVPDSEQDAETDPPAEPDLWSRGRGRLPGPLWILAAAGASALGRLGRATVLLRRLLRQRRAAASRPSHRP